MTTIHKFDKVVCASWVKLCADKSCQLRCPEDCPPNLKKCADGSCINRVLKCPEEPCPPHRPISCKYSTSLCYDIGMRCDNMVFCDQGDDEEGCFMGFDTQYPSKHLAFLIMMGVGVVTLILIFFFNHRNKQRTRANAERQRVLDTEGIPNAPGCSGTATNIEGSTSLPLTTTIVSGNTGAASEVAQEHPAPPPQTTLSVVPGSTAPPSYEDALNALSSYPPVNELPTYESAVQMISTGNQAHVA